VICDDAIFMRTMLSDILQQAGFDVVGEAETGAQVSTSIATPPPTGDDGRVMPTWAGSTRSARSPATTHGQVLMCSAMGQQALVVEAIQAGAKDFVVKPFQPSRVLEAVQRVLG
jgi:two-component system chemotaxis response regulator CheY